MPRRLLAVALLAATLAACSSGARRQASLGATQAGNPGSAASAAPTSAPATTRPAATTVPTATTATATTAGTTPAGLRYVFPVRGCAVSYGHSHHDYPATDIFAARGCLYVAPVAGTVDEVNRVDRWDPATNRGADRGGLSVSIVGDDGVRYYGSHFESVAPGIAHGIRVAAGTPLGRVGNSGDAAHVPSHVHFGLSWPTGPGIWWVRRGEVYPWPFLDAWRAGRQLSPAARVRAALRAAGSRTPRCSSDC